jgi:hypothetical protein
MTVVDLQDLIDQLDSELTDADPLTKLGEAQARARNLNDIGDQLVDHYVAQARDSGATWSQIGDALGVSKQAAQQRRVGGQYERFTARARTVVVHAQETARAFKHPTVGTEHVLLGLINESEGLAARILAKLAGPLDKLSAAITATMQRADGASVAHPPFDDECKQVLEQTLQEALELGHNYIGTEHILLGLLRVPECRAARLLAEAGADYSRTRDLVVGALIGYQHGKRA